MINEINSTTFDNTKTIDGDVFETVIGDEKQEDFFPRMKIKRWDNETNFSFGIMGTGTFVEKADGIDWTRDDGVIAKMDIQQPPTFTSGIDYVPFGLLDSKKIPAEYEMYTHVTLTKITVNTYTPNDASIHAFGENYDLTYFLNKTKVDLPQYRTDSPFNNPSYFDSGVVMIDIHVPDMSKLEEVADKWTQAVEEKFIAATVPVFRKDTQYHKLFYLDSEGEEQKFHSLEPSNNNVWAYINFTSDYLKILDYYDEEDLPKQFVHHDEAAASRGVSKDFPKIKPTIIDSIVTRFAELMGETLTERTATAEETALLTSVGDLLDTEEWSWNGQRTDVKGLRTEGNGIKFDLVYPSLATVPSNFKEEFTLQTKGLSFFKQEKLEEANALEGSTQKPDVINSYAVYHDTKAHNSLSGKNYKAGKAFHIYRPAVIDATGKKEWCDLNMREEDEILDVILPQTFMETATYPVQLDPTVGYTTLGAIALSIGNLVDCHVSSSAFEPLVPGISLTEAGVITSISAGVQILTGAGFRWGLYNGGRGGVVNLTNMPFVVETVEGSGNNVPHAFRALDVTALTDLDVRNYLITAWAASGGYGAQILYDIVAFTGAEVSLTYDSGGYPATLSVAPKNRRPSLFFTYQPASNLRIKGTQLQIKGTELRLT